MNEIRFPMQSNRVPLCVPDNIHDVIVKSDYISNIESSTISIRDLIFQKKPITCVTGGEESYKNCLPPKKHIITFT